MHEIEYLTEKDLQYFRKKAANGEPVYILHLDPEVLMNLDADSLGKDEEDGEMTAEEMSYWLSRHHALISEKEAEERAQERQKEKEAADAGSGKAGGSKTGGTKARKDGSFSQEEKPDPP